MFNLTRQEQLIILFLIGILLVGFGVKHYFSREQKVTVTPQESSQFSLQTTNNQTAGNLYSGQTIIVHIAGAVNNPGVYQLPFGSRIYDALTTAGDTTNQADVSELNLAAVIQDGDKIVIPIIGSKPESAQSSNVAQTPVQPNSASVNRSIVPPVQSSGSKKININTASQSELEILPGIGPKLAQRIILYRQQHGGFKRVDDIILVSGIGPKRTEQIKELITVR
ncbi:MAG: helix-hairpin-helix domain-containing protein [bacterium]|nr:helix-hairpin-helix domain-containing protein [bacterium]